MMMRWGMGLRVGLGSRTTQRQKISLPKIWAGWRVAEGAPATELAATNREGTSSAGKSGAGPVFWGGRARADSVPGGEQRLRKRSGAAEKNIGVRWWYCRHKYLYLLAAVEKFQVEPPP